jgi:hypothetical protein
MNAASLPRGASEASHAIRLERSLSVVVEQRPQSVAVGVAAKPAAAKAKPASKAGAPAAAGRPRGATGTQQRQHAGAATGGGAGSVRQQFSAVLGCVLGTGLGELGAGSGIAPLHMLRCTPCHLNAFALWAAACYSHGLHGANLHLLSSLVAGGGYP